MSSLHPLLWRPRVEAREGRPAPSRQGPGGPQPEGQGRPSRNRQLLFQDPGLRDASWDLTTHRLEPPVHLLRPYVVCEWFLAPPKFISRGDRGSLRRVEVHPPPSGPRAPRVGFEGSVRVVSTTAASSLVSSPSLWVILVRTVLVGVWQPPWVGDPQGQSWGANQRAWPLSVLPPSPRSYPPPPRLLPSGLTPAGTCGLRSPWCPEQEPF